MLQHAELIGEEEHRVARAPQQSRRGRGLVAIDQRRSRLNLEARQLQPNLRRSMNRLEEVLVAMDDFRGRLLQR